MRGRRRRDEHTSVVQAELLTDGRADRRIQSRWTARPDVGSGRCLLLRGSPCATRGRCIAPWRDARASARAARWSSMPSRSFSHTRGTARKTVGRHSRQVLGHGGEAAGEPRLASDGDRQEVAHHSLGDVAERQERQQSFALADVVDRGDLAQRPHDVGMAQHRPLRGSRRAARVHDRGDVLSLHVVGSLADAIGVPIPSVGAERPAGQSKEMTKESPGAASPIGEDDPLQSRQLVAHFENLAELGVAVDEADARRPSG